MFRTGQRRWACFLQEGISADCHSWKFRPVIIVKTINFWCVMELDWSSGGCCLFQTVARRNLFPQVNGVPLGPIQEELQTDKTWRNFHTSKLHIMLRTVSTASASTPKSHPYSPVGLTQGKSCSMTTLRRRSSLLLRHLLMTTSIGISLQKFSGGLSGLLENQKPIITLYLWGPMVKFCCGKFLTKASVRRRVRKGQKCCWNTPSKDFLCYGKRKAKWSQ